MRDSYANCVPASLREIERWGYWGYNAAKHQVQEA